MHANKDIVDRLKQEAQILSIVCACDKKGCTSCRWKKLLEEAAKEIEELRSLMDAMKEER